MMVQLTQEQINILEAAGAMPQQANPSVTTITRGYAVPQQDQYNPWRLKTKGVIGMIRLVKWQFPVHSDPYMFSTEIVLGNKIMLSCLQADNWQWGVVGLGLSKAERAIFDCKRFDFRGILNIYLGKWIVSYNRKGYKGHMKAVKITTDKVLI